LTEAKICLEQNNFLEELVEKVNNYWGSNL